MQCQAHVPRQASEQCQAVGGKVRVQALSANPPAQKLEANMHRHGVPISDITLIRTDTTLDLSPQAEKVKSLRSGRSC